MKYLMVNVIPKLVEYVGATKVKVQPGEFIDGRGRRGILINERIISVPEGGWYLLVAQLLKFQNFSGQNVNEVAFCWVPLRDTDNPQSAIYSIRSEQIPLAKVNKTASGIGVIDARRPLVCRMYNVEPWWAKEITRNIGKWQRIKSSPMEKPGVIPINAQISLI